MVKGKGNGETGTSLDTLIIIVDHKKNTFERRVLDKDKVHINTMARKF